MYKVFIVIVTLIAITYGCCTQQLEQTSLEYDFPELTGDKQKSEVKETPTPYSYGYRTDDGYGTKTTRQETGDENGYVKGSYSYTTALGITRVVHYISDEKGTRVVVNTNEPGTVSSSPSNVIIKSTPINLDYSKPAIYPTAAPNPTPSQNVAYTPVYPTSRPAIIPVPIQPSYPTKSVTQAPSPQPEYPAKNPTPIWPVTYTKYNPTRKPTLSTTTPAAYPVPNPTYNDDYPSIYPTSSAPLIPKIISNPALKSTKSSDKGERKTIYSSPAQNAAQLRAKPTVGPVLSQNYYPTRASYQFTNPTTSTQETSAPAPLWSPTYQYKPFNTTRRPNAGKSGRKY